MEDQGKRLLLAVAVAFAIMMAWSFLFPTEEPEEKPPEKPAPGAPGAVPGAEAPTAPGAAGSPAGAAGTPGATGTPGTTGTTMTPGADAPPSTVVRGPAHEVVFEYDNLRAVFTTHGGALRSWVLFGDKFEDKESGAQMDLVPTGIEGFATGAGIAEDLYPFVVGFDPVDSGTTHLIPPKAEWTVQDEAPNRAKNQVVFTWSSADLEVKKIFTIDPVDYIVSLEIQIKKVSPGEARQALRVTSFFYQHEDEGGGGGWTSIDRTWRTACFIGGDLSTNSAKYLAQKGPKTYRGDVQWAGAIHAYFLAAFSRKNDNQDQQSRCVVSAVEGAPEGTFRVDLVYGPPRGLEYNKFYARTVTAYLGPKYLGRIDEIDKVAGYETGFVDAIDLGFFAFISRPLLWLLQWFHGFVGNWGIAIILLTLVVKLATLYWTTKSMRSMRAMAKLKPQVEAIQKKFKEDRQRQQVEIMGLYKANKVSPLAGCLPMLLQMPIWFALYRTLMVAAELYHAPFIPGWIDDLTAPDPYYILPVALMVMMFLQAKLSPTTADSTQQKIMQYGLPLVFGFFGFFFPAGLTLYIFTNTSMTALHNVWMNRTDPMTAGTVVAAKSEGTSGRKSASKVIDVESSDESSDDASDEAGDEARKSIPLEPESGAARPSKRSGSKGKSRGKNRSKKKPAR